MGFRFFFHSNEGDPLEPLHIHVRKAEYVAKFWLEPEPGVARAYGLTSGELRELRELRAVAIENRELIRRYWNEHFGV
jgi:hypothetical protein